MPRSNGARSSSWPPAWAPGGRTRTGEEVTVLARIALLPTGVAMSMSTHHADRTDLQAALMNRRNALRLAAGAGAFVAVGGRAAAAEAAGGLTKVSLPPLPYAEDALEPSIDAMTMGIHHGKHHGGYTTKFQAALDAMKATDPVEKILASIPDAPEDVRTSVRNNGGGYWNHDLFWKVMAPAGQGGGGEPGGDLAKAVKSAFGSGEAMREEFSNAAGARFGSGWAWLVAKPDGKLMVTSTPNQDNPLMKGVVDDDQLGTPILGLDVWEHAYYLHYQNRRGDYVQAWWKVVNWAEVAKRYEAAMS